jgi:hypothetical protein
MVMSKSELIASLQNEVRILLHLAGKVDRAKLDYRPTPKQRGMIELLKYLSMMGPTLIQYALAETPDPDLWTTAAQAAEARDFDQTLAAIAAHTNVYEMLLTDVSDADFRAEVTGFDGAKTSRGSLITTWRSPGAPPIACNCFCTSKPAAARNSAR